MIILKTRVYVIINMFFLSIFLILAILINIVINKQYIENMKYIDK